LEVEWLEQKWNELKQRLREIYDIGSAISLLTWDQNTYMPAAAAEARGCQIATLARIQHEKMTDPALGRLLEDLAEWEKELPYESDEASLIRVVRREFEKESKISPEFISRFYNQTSKTFQAWVEAREKDDFSIVAPYLEKTLEYSREYAEFFPGYEHPADPHIDRSDYGMKAETIRRLFSQLRERLVPLVEAVTAKPPADNACLLQHYPKEKQLAFGEQLIQRLGFDFKRGRQDLAPHPFMIRFADGDVRITTRVDEHDLSNALFSTIHETGHALYELGINPAFEGTPLHKGTSSGVHESQSRLWENLAGRSREFWVYFYPKLQEMFPAQLGNVTLGEFYRAINRVERSLIRTEADELTYNLHVIIRFDLELALLEGSLSVKDLPEAWRSRYREDLGIVPPSDKLGVLQDVHWYFDFIGGMFQGYTLGNILSCQFYQAALKAYPDIPERMEKGNFSVLRGWLTENLYRHGSKFTAEEIVKMATGSDLTIEPYVDYLTKKYTALYL
jgi:carboxypeptidase Taq